MRKIVFKFSLFLLVGFLVLTNGITSFAAPHLTLSPASGSYSNGENFTVVIGVDSETETSGAVDVEGTYDFAKMDIVSMTKSANSVFPFQFVPNFDNTTGKFKFSCSNSDTSGLDEKIIKGELVTITFKAKEVGTGTVNFTCQTGSTVDSNIFNPSGNDVIGCASNQSGSYTITASASANNSQEASTLVETDSVTTTATELPKTGGIVSTLGLIVFGTVSVLGALFLRFL